MVIDAMTPRILRSFIWHSSFLLNKNDCCPIPYDGLNSEVWRRLWIKTTGWNIAYALNKRSCNTLLYHQKAINRCNQWVQHLFGINVGNTFIWNKCGPWRHVTYDVLLACPWSTGWSVWGPWGRLAQPMLVVVIAIKIIPKGLTICRAPTASTSVT